jgi:hypothetical protein
MVQMVCVQVLAKDRLLQQEINLLVQAQEDLSAAAVEPQEQQALVAVVLVELAIFSLVVQEHLEQE